MNNNQSKYITFWVSQTISQLGSAITGFALTIWVFEQTGSAMAVSFAALCTYLPYIIGSVFAGDAVDRLPKKAILIAADVVAALGTVSIALSLFADALPVWQIYIVNAVIGFANAFQGPASAVVTGMLVKDGQYDRVSGLNSFSSNLVMIVSPMLAGALIAFAGLEIVLLIDVLTFAVAAAIVLFFVAIKDTPLPAPKEAQRALSGFGEGMAYLKQHRGILHSMLSMALINFFSRLTYENILSPMILSRSGGNSAVFGMVSGVLGVGGVLGGLLVTVWKKNSDPVKRMYFSIMLSFLCGDLLMAVGQNVWVWCIAGLAASIPIPFIMAGQNVIMYEMIPPHMRGRVFAVRNAIQSSSIPIAILLGGYLAQNVFEPFMASPHALAQALKSIVGTGAGSGMAVMFLCTGILGAASGLIGYRDKAIQGLRKKR